MKLKKKDILEENDFPEDELDDDSDDDLGSDDDNLFDEDLGMDYSGAQPPIAKHADLLSKLTNFDPYLRSLIMEWLGMTWDDNEKKYVKDESIRPMMNINGARWCINFLKTYTRDNNIITTLTESTYLNILTDVIYVSYVNIGTRSDEFGIHSDGDILAICNQLIHAVDLVLVGAGGSKTYTDFLGTATTRHENVSSNNQQIQGPQYSLPAPGKQKQNIINKLKGYLQN